MADQQPVQVDASNEPASKPPLRRAVVTDRIELSDDQRLYGMLSHLLGIVSGPIAALVIWLVKKDDKWVEKEAREALNFQVTVLLAQLIGMVLLIILVGILVIIAVSVLNIVFCVIAAAHAHGGEGYRYPLTLRLIKGSS